MKPVPNKPIEELGLSPEGHYIQIVSINPIWVPLKFKEKKNVTPFDKQHMVDHFGFEAPYAPSGGKISEVHTFIIFCNALLLFIVLYFS